MADLYESLPDVLIAIIFSFIPFSGSDWLHIKLINKKSHLVANRVFDPTKADALERMAARLYPSEESLISLIRYPKIDPSWNDNNLIAIACSKSFERLVELLLQDPRVDPGARRNFQIGIASYRGCLKIVNMLLQDERVDPSAHDSYSIRMASEMNHPHIVERLLQDPRVNPSACDNHALVGASHFGYPEVVKILLRDERVDPMAVNLKIVRSRNRAVLDLLLQDPRIPKNRKWRSKVRTFLHKKGE
eukprot:TRINITY_DN2441_c0_g1_i1.p1 TRINITY_DN2441_c0_g1~~TRINITY_DN2441_c0_g1_i1.p1  ORF type:complete len:247 (-),score=36.58 TRINITY_DN2441_c0_g1_i1:50-790(-)